MLSWLKRLIKQPGLAGPPRPIRAFSTSSQPITQDGVTVDQNGWRIDSRDKRTVRLFDVPVSSIEQCMVTYRAQMKTANVQGGAYLEMWCRFPGKGEFFSRGLQTPVSGTTDWTTEETPFFLQKGENPDNIKLNLVMNGTGTAWIDDIRLLKGALQ